MDSADDEDKEWSKDRVLAEMRGWEASSWEAFTTGLRAGLRLGPDQDHAIAPFTQGVADDFFDVVLLQDDVPVHEQPDHSSRVLARLGHVVIVHRDEPKGEDREGWVCVRSTEGVTGYVPSDDALRFMTTEISFARRGDGWRVVGYGAADC